MPGPLLLLMDYQESICRESGRIGRERLGAEVKRRGALDAAGRALAQFRERQRDVVHVRVAFDDEYTNMISAAKSFAAIKANGLLLASDPETRICDEVAPLSNELVVTKGCTNSFIGTHLGAKLVGIAPSQLVMGGVATNHVVETTARYAADTGFSVVVLEDLCASFSAELHEFATTQILPRYITVTTSDAYFGSEMWAEG